MNKIELKKQTIYKIRELTMKFQPEEPYISNVVLRIEAELSDLKAELEKIKE